MKRQWTPDELAEHWTLTESDKDLIANKAGATRLGFAVLLRYFHHDGRFPPYKGDVPTIDGATNTVTATIGVGISPLNVVVNSRTNTIYVANCGSNTVSVIDGATNTVTKTLGAGAGIESCPGGIALDPRTSTVYVANGSSNTVTVLKP